MRAIVTMLGHVTGEMLFPRKGGRAWHVKTALGAIVSRPLCVRAGPLTSILFKDMNSISVPGSRHYKRTVRSATYCVA